MHTGYLLLEGGAEFGGAMSEPDLQAIQLAGGLQAPIAVLPTAAAPDNNHRRAGRDALNWFRSLGARNADIVPVIDKDSANDASLAEQLRVARLIYMLGGFPRHLADTLRDSLAWEAAAQAYAAGAILGGSSAGAMVLCEHCYDPESAEVFPGLNLLPNACILPHHNRFGRNWSKQLMWALPSAMLIGIDERTGILDDGAGNWNVYGAGQVTIYRQGRIETYGKGKAFRLFEG